MVELDLDLGVWGSLFNTYWGRSKILNQNELWESNNYLTSDMTVESYYTSAYYASLLHHSTLTESCTFIGQRKTLKQMHWKREDVFTEQTFYALFSTTYAFVFMEIGSIKQAMEGKGPDYPHKSYLFKHLLERTTHFKIFSWVYFHTYNLHNPFQKLIYFRPSNHLCELKLVGLRKLIPVHLQLPKGKRKPSLQALPRESFHLAIWT